MGCEIKQCTVMLTDFKDEDFSRGQWSNFYVEHVESGNRVWFNDVLDKAEETIKDGLKKEKKPKPEDVCGDDEDCECKIVTKDWGDWEPDLTNIDPPVEFEFNGVKYKATTMLRRRTGTGKGWCRAKNVELSLSKTYYKGEFGELALAHKRQLTKDQISVLIDITGAKLG